MNAEQVEALCLELATRIRGAVLPALGDHAARAHAGSAAHGDVTFGIDELGERELEALLAASPIPLALHSEDRGHVDGDGAEWLLVVDPVDGTRPALAGFEAACVSVAAAPNVPDPTLGDVEVGVVLELKSGRSFAARRGAGVRADDALAPSTNEDLGRLFWAAGYRGRPARELTEVLASLIDASSVGGGYFDLGSASYILTRVATGQLDAYVDVGPRLVAERAGAAHAFRRVGSGSILCNQPYDLAAALVVLDELGVPTSDAWGRPLRDVPLLGSGEESIVSCLVAATPGLHERLLAEVDRAFGGLEAESAWEPPPDLGVGRLRRLLQEQ